MDDDSARNARERSGRDISGQGRHRSEAVLPGASRITGTRPLTLTLSPPRGEGIRSRALNTYESTDTIVASLRDASGPTFLLLSAMVCGGDRSYLWAAARCC